MTVREFMARREQGRRDGATGAGAAPGPGLRPADRPEPARRLHLRGPQLPGLRGRRHRQRAGRCGQWLLSRSFKYHRPRGICRWPGTTPTRWCSWRTSRTCSPTATASSRAWWSGPELPRLARPRPRRVDAPVRRFLPVGFYYKAFHRPKGAWKRWEPIIRSFAGLGRVNLERAAPLLRQGLRLLRRGRGRRRAGRHERGARGGGARRSRSCWSRRSRSSAARSPTPASAPSRRGAAGAWPAGRRDRGCPNITVHTDAVCNGLFADNWLPVIRGNRIYKVRAQPWSSPPARSSSRWCSATTTCPAIMLARRRSG